MIKSNKINNLTKGNEKRSTSKESLVICLESCKNDFDCLILKDFDKNGDKN